MSDQATRAQALNLSESYIVQAPAGSGKTELLIQRFLAALANCQQFPEEVVAITFTRKAAAEMKARVIDALLLAKSGQTPKTDHAKKTYNLACQVLEKEQVLNWQIIEQQQKICIMTIDALCSCINLQSKQFTGTPHPAPNVLYKLVVEDFLHDLIQENNRDLKDCLLFFDHQPLWFKQILCESLANRDQWLPLILENKDIINASKKYISAIWKPLKTEFYQLRKTASKAMMILSDSHDAKDMSEEQILKAYAKILLTNDGTARKSLTKKQGFPASNTLKSEKAIVLQFALENQDLFRAIQSAPLIEDDKLLTIIPKIFNLLKQLVAYLKYHMHENSSIDFIESSAQTVLALQDSIDWPASDGMPHPNQIRHLLLDEFQDTSKQQFKLISSLLMHSDTSKNTSIFIVGDPMQSIYRFRQADVNLFYRVKECGIAHLKPIALTLHANFRSNSQLIKYFNNLFPSIFPSTPLAKIGAVPYTPATSNNSNSACIKFFKYPEVESQFIEVANICASNQDKKIGILVRSRAIANALLPYLKDFIVTEHGLKPLYKEAEVKDLLAITNFILKPYDKLVISNLLRSRLVGISMQELYDILKEDSDIIESLASSENIKYKNISQILHQTRKLEIGATISDRTINLWSQLSPYASTNPKQSTISWQYLEHLQAAEDSQPLDPMPILHELLKGPNTSSEPGNIDIMTIHHAKGLEFDIVILPCLEKNSANRSGRILWWDESESGFLWLPNHPNQNTISLAHKYIYDLEKQKDVQEQIRLLYVAMTRAKEGLYCLSSQTSYVGNSFCGLLIPWLEFEEKASLCAEIQQEASIEILVHKPKPILNEPEIAELSKVTESHERVLGVAYHYWLHLYLVGCSDLRIQTRLYLLEQNIEENYINDAVQAIESSWPKVLCSDFFVWLSLAQEVWSEYSIHVAGRTHIIDACIFKDGYCWLLDFKTNAKPCQQVLNKWYQQTSFYRKVLASHVACKIELLIYNPISDTLWCEKDGSYVRTDSNTCFAR